MAEGEAREKQDIGADEANSINMKMVVADEKDCAGRTRSYYDMAMVNLLQAQAGLSSNFAVSMGALNQQTVALIKQGLTTSGKNDENIIGVNETDHIVGQILKSPWGEAMKTIATGEVAKALADKKKS
jgi:hypothetical protein